MSEYSGILPLPLVMRIQAAMRNKFQGHEYVENFTPKLIQNFLKRDFGHEIPSHVGVMVVRNDITGAVDIRFYDKRKPLQPMKKFTD
jgi:hypothetical protein